VKNNETTLEISNLKRKIATDLGIKYMKVEVGWLITSLHELINARQQLDNLNEEREKCYKQIQILENEYNEWQEKVNKMTGELNEAKSMTLVEDSLQKKRKENSLLTTSVFLVKSELKKKLGKTWSVRGFQSIYSCLPLKDLLYLLKFVAAGTYYPSE
jgi:FtsZ-binding cell division protein ZapB